MNVIDSWHRNIDPNRKFISVALWGAAFVGALIGLWMQIRDPEWSERNSTPRQPSDCDNRDFSNRANFQSRAEATQDAWGSGEAQASRSSSLCRLLLSARVVTPSDFFGSGMLSGDFSSQNVELLTQRLP